MGYIFDALNNKKSDDADNVPEGVAPLEVDDTGLSALIESAEQAQAEQQQDTTPLRISDVQAQIEADHSGLLEIDHNDELAAPISAAMNLTPEDADHILPQEPAQVAITPDTGAQAQDSIDSDTELGEAGPLVIQNEEPPPVKGIWNRLMGRHLRGKVDDRLVAMTSPASAMSEEYRSIRTSILARNESDRHLVHTITSATPQEGKTITCVNLGLAFAELRNRNTVILECDLRLPTFAKLLNCRADKPGLIDYLRGDATLSEIVQMIEGSPLHIIPAGGRVSDEAVQLLSSGRMNRLIQALRTKYDHVLIDTPPVLQLADAGILGSQSEEVLLVARMRRTPRPLVEQAVKRLISYNAQVSGIVATDNPRSRGRGYGYKYGYGYRYGYGYTYGYTDDKLQKPKKQKAKQREAA